MVSESKYCKRGNFRVQENFATFAVQKRPIPEKKIPGFVAPENLRADNFWECMFGCRNFLQIRKIRECCSTVRIIQTRQKLAQGGKENDKCLDRLVCLPLAFYLGHTQVIYGHNILRVVYFVMEFWSQSNAQRTDRSWRVCDHKIFIQKN